MVCFVSFHRCCCFSDLRLVSQEGYPTEMNGFRLPKTLPRERCFGKADEDILAWDLFIGVMKHKPDCGDASELKFILLRTID